MSEKDKNKNTKSIPLNRPKHISDEQWNRAVRIYETAVKHGDKFPELTVAQGALETGWFKKDSLSESNNWFGQKGTKSQKTKEVNTTEVRKGGKSEKSIERFRAYDSLDEAIQDRMRLWGSKYKDAETPQEALNAIWQLDPKNNVGKGYATDPKYGSKITSILKTLGVDPGTETKIKLDPKDIIESPFVDNSIKEDLILENDTTGLNRNIVQQIQGNDLEATIDQYTSNSTPQDTFNNTQIDLQKEVERVPESTISNAPPIPKQLLGIRGPIRNLTSMTEINDSLNKVPEFPSDFKLLGDSRFRKGGLLGDPPKGATQVDKFNRGENLNLVQYPNYNSLNEYELKYFNNPGPIGDSIRKKAKMKLK